MEDVIANQIKKVEGYETGIHVVWKRGEWSVLDGSDMNHIMSFSERFEAYSFAKKISNKVFVHSKDGSVAFKYTYGKN